MDQARRCSITPMLGAGTKRTEQANRIILILTFTGTCMTILQYHSNPSINPIVYQEYTLDIMVNMLIQCMYIRLYTYRTHCIVYDHNTSMPIHKDNYIDIISLKLHVATSIFIHQFLYEGATYTSLTNMASGFGKMTPSMRPMEAPG